MSIVGATLVLLNRTPFPCFRWKIFVVVPRTPPPTPASLLAHASLLCPGLVLNVSQRISQGLEVNSFLFPYRLQLQHNVPDCCISLSVMTSRAPFSISTIEPKLILSLCSIRARQSIKCPQRVCIFQHNVMGPRNKHS